MEVYRKLEELERECITLGLVVSGTGKKGKILRNDYALALQKYHLQKKYGFMVPEHVLKRMSIPNLMLCYRFQDLDLEVKKGIWTSPDWIVEEKINGLRAILIYDSINGLHFYSREPNAFNFMYDEYSVECGNFNKEALPLFSFILDVELVCKGADLMNFMSAYGQVNSNLEALNILIRQPNTLELQKNGLALSIYGLHLIEMNGSYYNNISYKNMRSSLEQIVSMLCAVGLNIEVLPIVGGIVDKSEFYDRLVEQGREGVVLKHIDSIYHMTGSRYHKHWIKVKDVVQRGVSHVDGSDVAELNGFITGYKHIDIGSGGRFIEEIEVSSNVMFLDGHSEVIKIADIPIEDMGLKLDMSCIGMNGIFLKENYYNRVIEFSGSFSPKDNKVRNPRFLRFRDDMNTFGCLLRVDY